MVIYETMLARRQYQIEQSLAITVPVLGLGHIANFGSVAKTDIVYHSEIQMFELTHELSIY